MNHLQAASGAETTKHYGKLLLTCAFEGSALTKQDAENDIWRCHADSTFICTRKQI